MIFVRNHFKYFHKITIMEILDINRYARDWIKYLPFPELNKSLIFD